MCAGYWFSEHFLVQDGGRKPWHSVNFVTAHDGFSLADLVSYNRKHNVANGEDNNDGETHNNSWNCGEVCIFTELGPKFEIVINFLKTLGLRENVYMLHTTKPINCEDLI